jgi:class 3 adenylate cyclase
VSDTGPSAEMLSIVMTDVEGSTALRRTRGDQFVNEILGLHGAIVRDQIGTCGGKERQFLGDGFLLSFPSSSAAVRCAIGVQRAHDAHNPADPQRQVRVRIGIHVGEVSEREGLLYGQAVHVAARITAEAAGGQILVSDAVRQQVEPGAEWRFVDSGLFWLKGFDERWRLFEVSRDQVAPLQRRGVMPPPLTPMVGRDSEQANLRRAVDEALAGRGGLALVAGEAGVGKSRLVAEIGGEAEARGMRLLTGHCVEMDSAPPYLPYVEMIEQAISSPRSPLALREALGDVAPEIARIAPALRRIYPDIAPPVELPPELARRYLWNSFREFVTRGAQTQPEISIALDRRDEPCSFGLLEGVDEGVGVHTGHLTDEIRGEDPAGHRRRDQRLAGASGQPREPLPDDQPDAFRYRRLGDLEVRSYPPALVEQHSGLGQMQVQLFDEERVTLRLAVDDPDQLLWRRLPGQRLNHGLDAPEGQSAQADPVDEPPTAELINHA